MKLLVEVICSDPSCAELEGLVVDVLDDVDREACPCGCAWAFLRASALAA